MRAAVRAVGREETMQQDTHRGPLRARRGRNPDIKRHANTHPTTTPHNTTQQSTIQYSTIQRNTIQYIKTKDNTTQHNTIQYNTIQYNSMFNSNKQYIQYNTHTGVRMVVESCMDTRARASSRQYPVRVFWVGLEAESGTNLVEQPRRDRRHKLVPLLLPHHPP
jgi:hypothetical protein